VGVPRGMRQKSERIGLMSIATLVNIEIIVSRVRCLLLVHSKGQNSIVIIGVMVQDVF
jgi:hypothetical protein